jgi:hypothetical protein
VTWSPDVPSTTYQCCRLLSDIKVGRELLFVNHEFLDVLTRPE